MITKEIPKDFESKFKVVACYVECEGQILLLHRQPEKSEGGKWGLPAGKVDEGESDTIAMVRELREETGIQVAEEKLELLGTGYVRYPDHDFLYTMYRVRFPGRLTVRLSPAEHQDFKWVTPEEASRMELVRDQDEALRMVYSV